MTNTIVLDASVAIALARGEPDGAAAEATLARSASSGGHILVPSHFWLEVTNILIRRHRWTGAETLSAIHILDDLDLVTVDLDRSLVVSMIDVAERHALSAYDATYLALIESMDGSLMTSDKALRRAAGARAVGVDGHRLSEAAAPYEHEVTWPRYKGASAFLAKLRAEARDAAAG